MVISSLPNSLSGEDAKQNSKPLTRQVPLKRLKHPSTTLLSHFVEIIQTEIGFRHGETR